ncbi:MAG: S8 family serine peptidase [Thiohalomonadales bacterium]
MAGKKVRSSSKQNQYSLGGSERELVVLTSADSGLRASPDGLTSATGIDTSPLTSLLETEDIVLTPMFVDAENNEDLSASLDSATYSDEPQLSQFYNVEAADDKLDDLVQKLLENPLIDAAYIKPPAELASVVQADIGTADPFEEENEGPINDMQPEVEGPPATPSFISRQGYLNPAPSGVDARYAWRYRGGGGSNVRVIDLEWGWRFTHEDLRRNQGGVIAGNNSPNSNHGTAVIGVIGGDRSSFGVTGISPDAHVSGVSFTTIRTAPAIRLAANRLRRGDIMLLEIHRPGPRSTGAGQQGYIAIEWWPDDFAAIRYATSRGIIVVEAAGNGAQNFDDSIYNARPAGFPASWRNPLNASNPSSYAVVVGAGAPPPGTHRRNHGPDRSRLGFSNYGRRVDCQGWGREVTTTGYGDLQGGANPDRIYTDRFSGTSSASPVIVGSLACVQGILRSLRRSVLTPAAAIRLLRTTGSPQTNAPARPRTQRIGNRPNLRHMINRLIRTPVRTAPLYRYWNARTGDHFYTTNWRELGRGRLGYRYEGVACYIFPRRVSATVPLYRYWNPRNTDHFYTTNWRELGRGRLGYRYEGIQGYVQSRRVAGSIPLYRYWNPRNGDHFYTTRWSEIGRGRYGYRFEGIQCYVYARPTVLRIATPEASEIEQPLPNDVDPENILATEETYGPESVVDFDDSQNFLEKVGIVSPDQADTGVDAEAAEFECIDESEEDLEPSDSFQMLNETDLPENALDIADSFTPHEDGIANLDDSFTMDSEAGSSYGEDSFSSETQQDSQGNIVINLNLGKK